MKSSKYAKAYPISRLREFCGWTERPTDLGSDGYVLLHDNFIVTHGLWVDQDIVFDAVTDQWKDFCRQALGFQTIKAGDQHSDRAQATQSETAAPSKSAAECGS